MTTDEITANIPTIPPPTPEVLLKKENNALREELTSYQEVLQLQNEGYWRQMVLKSMEGITIQLSQLTQYLAQKQ